MGKTYLIAGTSCAVTTEFIQGALSRKNRVVAALDPKSEQLPLEPDWEKNLHYLQWNRRSPLSAKTFVTGGVNAFDGIDEALFVYVPAESSQAMHEIPLAEIEEAVDNTIKGLYYLLKELCGFFQKRKAGALTFVYCDKGAEVLPPLEAGAAGAFRALVPTLHSNYRNSGFLVRGFTSQTDQPKDFADYVFGFSDKTDKTAGRWIKYTGKAGFFSFGRKQA